jgi:serine/threonine protein kinase/tetratricopeptide (TPR) repeat protein
MIIAAGTKLGRYEIRSPLGAGGMGEVYLAFDTELDRTVAIKILPEVLASNEERLQRFIQEAKAASALNHPHILTIHEIGTAGGLPFIATEFIDGDTLRQHLGSAATKLEEILELAIQTASALAAAHAAGIIHRDIKPENIMVRRDGYIKLLDFGLAKLFQPLGPLSDPDAPTKAMVNTGAGIVMGTLNYMSPEQAKGTNVDARTDLWGLGAVLYEMVTGHAPFAAETPTETISLILQKEPVPLTHYNHAVPAELDRIVTKSLTKDREQRYQTAKDLLIDLRNLKRKLEVNAEIDRTASPESRHAASMSSGQIAPAIAAGSMPGTAPGGATPVGSSAEYIVSGIKQHKVAAIISLLVLAVGIAGLGVYLRTRNTEVAIESIAVLPFVNTSGDANTDYLSEGITESLLNSLSQIPGLRVIPRSTVFRYKGKEIDALAIGKELGVRAILTGRLSQRGDNLSVSVELVDVRDNKQLWGQQYSRKLADALAVQQEISREITDRLRIRLTSEQQGLLTRRDTGNPEAYQSYLKGRYYWNKRTAENIKKAAQQFQQAADQDPGYALAYVGLADCYLVSEEYSSTPATETAPKAKAFAERALELDGSLVEARTSLAHAYQKMWQWEEAEREFKRAIQLNPNYATAHQWYGLSLRDRGRLDEGLVELKRAEELDALSLVIGTNLVEGYWTVGDLNSAVAQGKKMIDLDPTFPRAHDNLGLAYLQQGRHAEALEETQKALVLSSSGDRRPLRDLGYVYGVTGRRDQALAILKQILENYEKQEALAQDVAGVYVGLGQKDEAFAWLEKAFARRSGLLPRIRWEPPFAPLRSDPRYAHLLQRMGLQP